MPVNKNVHQPMTEKGSTKRETLPTALRRSGRKAPGTRFGTLADWREGFVNSANASSRYGKAIRDGR